MCNFHIVFLFRTEQCHLYINLRRSRDVFVRSFIRLFVRSFLAVCSHGNSFQYVHV